MSEKEGMSEITKYEEEIFDILSEYKRMVEFYRMEFSFH